MTAVQELLEALVDAQEDLEDGYAGRTKVSATRARKALKIVKDSAHEARKELLAIRKEEQDPVELDVNKHLCTREECDLTEDEAEESSE